MDNLMNGIQEGFPSQTLIRMPLESVQSMKQLALARALYVTDIGFYPEAQNHYVNRPEGCPNYILIYCLGGSGWAQISDIRWELGPGQAILIPANVAHAYGTGEDQSWRIHWLHFNGTEAQGLFYALHEQLDNPLIYLPRPDPILAAFEDTMRWTRQSHTQRCLIALSGSCARLLGLIAEGRRPTAQRTREVEERVRSTITRMRERMRKPLCLDALAEEASLSVPHYCALFKKQTGRTPMQLYTDMRIRRSCELLHNTHLGIQEIAHEVGYEDSFYFSRAFKKTMGQSPSQYRRSMD